MTKIYIASKITHAKKWLSLWESHPMLHLVTRWPSLVSCGIKESSDLAERFWLDDEADVARCDILIVYAEEGEHLMGGLVEVGMALAFGKPVFVVGTHPDYSTWQYHPKVERLKTLEEALELAIRFDGGDWF